MESAVTESEWQGFRRLDFVVAGHHAILIVPDEPAPGKPWVWRAEWFGVQHGSQAALELLKQGWHYAYFNAKDLYGAPAAMALFDAYYQHVTEVYGLADKLVMEGFSRGGLYAVNFAAKWPERIEVLYLDAPALDLRSWPGYQTKRWPEVVSLYGLSLAEADTTQFSPIEQAEVLAEAGIPIIAVSGDEDKTVPHDENILPFAERFRTAGGMIELILKPGGGHHPHSLPDPQPIVDFILEHRGR